MLAFSHFMLIVKLALFLCYTAYGQSAIFFYFFLQYDWLGLSYIKDTGYIDVQQAFLGVFLVLCEWLGYIIHTLNSADRMACGFFSGGGHCCATKELIRLYLSSLACPENLFLLVTSPVISPVKYSVVISLCLIT